MRLARDSLLDLVAVTLVLATLLSAVRSTMLPRAVRSRISRVVFTTTRIAFRLSTGRSPSYERRDRVMAMYGPVALLLLLSSWYVLLVTGFTAAYLGNGISNLGTAFKMSGSAVFTLGTTSDPRLIPSIFTYVEAGFGLLILTLLITYLPTMYGVFSLREASVAQLQVRAGNPPAAWTMLIRFHRIGMATRLTDLWQHWEGWFAALEESHTSFPVLAFFRSPQPDQSWVTAAGTVLDAAALWASTVEHPNDPDAQLCIRAGFVALRRLADFFGVAYDANPDPDDPITISRPEYDEVIRKFEEAEMPLRADRDAAWQSFKGWRVNYDTVLLNLARMFEAPIAPWTSDRSPVNLQQQWTLRGMVIRHRPRSDRRWRHRARRS